MNKTAAIVTGGIGLGLTGILIWSLTRGASASSKQVILTLKNPPSVDGFWQTFICSAEYPATGYKVIQFNADAGAQADFNGEAVGDVPAGFNFPGKLVVWVFQWNDTGHSTASQIGGRQALGPDWNNNGLSPYDDGFILPKAGKYAVDYTTGEIIEV